MSSISQQGGDRETARAIARPPFLFLGALLLGFVSDHLEILWDLDIAARDKAQELGLQCERTDSLNDDPRFVSALAGVVERARQKQPVATGRTAP